VLSRGGGEEISTDSLAATDAPYLTARTHAHARKPAADAVLAAAHGAEPGSAMHHCDASSRSQPCAPEGVTRREWTPPRTPSPRTAAPCASRDSSAVTTPPPRPRRQRPRATPLARSSALRAQQPRKPRRRLADQLPEPPWNPPPARSSRAAASLSRAFHRALRGGGVSSLAGVVHRRPHTGVATACPPGSAVAGPIRSQPHAGPHRAEPHDPLTGSRAAATSGSATRGPQGAGRSGSGRGIQCGWSI
jgi:hypothetical protein